MKTGVETCLYNQNIIYPQSFIESVFISDLMNCLNCMKTENNQVEQQIYNCDFIVDNKLQIQPYKKNN